MAVGILKCGWMAVDNIGLRRQMELEKDNLKLQGQVVPQVDSYDYLGIKLEAGEILSTQAHVEERVTKFKKRWQSIQFFLRSHSIPTQVRLHIFKMICMPVLRWGSEIMGPSAVAVQPAATEYNNAVKAIIGSRSKNTIYSLLALRTELNLPTFQEIAIRSRARAMFKFPTLNTWVTVLMERPFRSRSNGWVKSSSRWLKTAKIAIGPEAKEEIKEYFIVKRDTQPGHDAKAWRQYQEHGFERTQSYIKWSGDYHLVSRGITWVLRARVGGIWTAKRAAKLDLIDADRGNKCPACDQVIDEEELVHIVLHCWKYAQPRACLVQDMAAALEAALEPKVKVTLLLGSMSVLVEDAIGQVAPPWTVAQWTGEDGETLLEGGKPGCVIVAEFFQKVMPEHMASLWRQ
jgi:hypothetical protein